ncbi:MAG: alkyl sulfatase C-terminal domain-containing protein [Promethearchaeota archaeon]|jgi:alkyl sulfatase BDS1-like metallo-beta-lactamase superfamily hydrolase
MVEQSLIDELKGKISAGAAASVADDVLKSFELIKQISEEVDYLKGDVDESDYTCQIVFSDLNENYWIKVSKGSVEYDKGKLDDPTFTITASKEVGLGLFYGELDANIVSPRGKLGVAGNYTQLRLFQELYEDAIEEFQKKYN